MRQAGGAPRPGPGGAGLRPAFPRWGAGPASCGNRVSRSETYSAPGGKSHPPNIMASSKNLGISKSHRRKTTLLELQDHSLYVAARS